MLFKVVFLIICSHSMHALQPSDSGKRITAESCSQYDKNTFEYATQNINHYQETFYTFPLKAV